MRVIVEPGQQKTNTHHISLTDNQGHTVGLIATDASGFARLQSINQGPQQRTSLKTTAGSATYDDYEPPWQPIAQNNWGGGRAQDNFDADNTRYSDGKRAYTINDYIVNGPQETYATGVRMSNQHLPGSVSWKKVIGTFYAAQKFTPSAGYTAVSISVLIRRIGTPATGLTVAICSDLAGGPGTVLKSSVITTTEITDYISEFYRCVITAQALSSGVPYWVQISNLTGDDTDRWEVGVDVSAGGLYTSTNGAVWTLTSEKMYFRVADTETGYSAKFYQYKYATYCILQSAGSNPKLFINGDRGTADANTGNLTALNDATKAWIPDQWDGGVVVVTSGTGILEPQSWRLIASNGASQLVLSTAWTITHDTTTEYVIIGANTWREITGHGLVGTVTDICVNNNIVYFCLGDAVNIRRHREYTNAGVWMESTAAEWADDSTNKAHKMCTVRDSTSGAIEVWKGNNSDAAGAISYAVSATVVWPNNLSFGAATTFVDSLGKITNLSEYGDPKTLWIQREGSVFALSADLPDEIPLKEIHALMSTDNGAASLSHNVYLYLPLATRLERYYNKILDDIGPDRDEGLPANRQGVILSLMGYPGRIYITVDGGASGYSSVFASKAGSSGWHEIYRAPAVGLRITNIYFQVVPGLIDKIWIAQGTDLISLPVPKYTSDPTKDSLYRYTHESVVESSWIYAGLVDINKIYNTFKTLAENMVEDKQFAELYYKVDDETTWTKVEEQYHESPISEHALNLWECPSGKRLRWRLHLHTTDNTKSTKVTATVVDVMAREDVRYTYTLVYRFKDSDLNLLGEPDSYEFAGDKQRRLQEWGNKFTPLLMRTGPRAYDNYFVFIDAIPSKPSGDTTEVYEGTIRINEIRSAIT